ncbi:MAG: double zinc ribbon domain-containing protein [Gaiellales bacterium]
MDQHNPPQRSSLADLIAALVLTLLVGVYLFGLTAFAVFSQADIDKRNVTDGDVATVFIVPAVGGLVLAAFVITRWRSGWSSIWKAPLIVLIGGVFWPALFLLISGSVRRGLLPTRRGHDGSCSACGVTLMPDAVFCQACGTPQPRRSGHGCAVCGYELPDGARWCPGCGAAVLDAPRAGHKPRRFTTAGVIVGFVAAFAGLVGFLTYLVEADRPKLPVTEDFSGQCLWPVGSNHAAPANFEYGCNGETYVLTVHNKDAYYVSQPVDVTADAVKYEVDASVTSGRGTEPRVSPASALLGIACMPRERRGYAGLVGTNGTTEIERWAGQFTGVTGHSDPGTVAGMDGTTRPGTVHLGIVCARQHDGTSLVGLYVNGTLTDAYRDATGYRSFRQVALYTATYPGTVSFDAFRATKPAQSDLDAISAAAE